MTDLTNHMEPAFWSVAVNRTSELTLANLQNFAKQHPGRAITVQAGGVEYGFTLDFTQEDIEKLDDATFLAKITAAMDEAFD